MAGYDYGMTGYTRRNAKSKPNYNKPKDSKSTSKPGRNRGKQGNVITQTAGKKAQEKIN